MNTNIFKVAFVVGLLFSPVFALDTDSEPSQMVPHQPSSSQSDMKSLQDRMQERSSQNMNIRQDTMKNQGMDRKTFTRDSVNNKDSFFKERDDSFKATVRDHDTFKDRDLSSGKFGDGVLVVKVKEVLKQDPALAVYADAVDVIECNGNVIVFGVVDSDSVKTDFVAKIKSVEGVSNVQNKIIVK